MLTDFFKWLWLQLGVLAYQAVFLALCAMVAIPYAVYALLRPRKPLEGVCLFKDKGGWWYEIPRLQYKTGPFIFKFMARMNYRREFP